MAFKKTKLVGRKSTALDPALTKRSGVTSTAPKRNSRVAAQVPTGGDKGRPSVPSMPA